MKDDSPARRRGGQPKPEAERKRNNLTFRARDVLREQLAIEANRNGRSLSEEIEHRLEQSFVWDGSWRKARKVLADMGARTDFLSERDKELVEQAVAATLRRLEQPGPRSLKRTGFQVDPANPLLTREHGTVQ